MGNRASTLDEKYLEACYRYDEAQKELANAKRLMDYYRKEIEKVMLEQQRKKRR